MTVILNVDVFSFFQLILQCYFVKLSLTFSLHAKRDFVCLVLIGVADGGNILCDVFRWMELNSKSKHRCSVDEMFEEKEYLDNSM